MSDVAMPESITHPGHIVLLDMSLLRRILIVGPAGHVDAELVIIKKAEHFASKLVASVEGSLAVQLSTRRSWVYGGAAVRLGGSALSGNQGAFHGAH